MSSVAPFSTPQRRNLTIVVGAGPGGLLCALYKLRNGDHVSVYEQRLDFTSRNNSVFLQHSIVCQLLKDFTQFYQCGYQLEFKFSPYKMRVQILYNPVKAKRFAAEAAKLGNPAPQLSALDLEFINNLKRNNGNLRISEFQYYVQSKIEEYCAQNPEQDFSIHNATVKEVIEENSTIIYSEDNITTKTQSYDCLIIAEGSKRKLAKQIFGEEITALKNVDYLKCAHAVGFVEMGVQNRKLVEKSFITKPTSSPFTPLGIALNRADIAAFAQHGWPHNALPNFYLRIEVDMNRIYFACEIPETWLKSAESTMAIQNEINKILQQWIIIAISKEYPDLDRSGMKLITEGAEKAQTFVSTPTVMKKAYKQTNNGAHIFLSADALFSSVYKLGTGHCFAGLAAKAIAQCYDDQGNFISSQPFTSLVANLNVKYKELQFIYDTSKLMQEHPVKTAYIVEPVHNTINNFLWLYRKVTQPQVTEVNLSPAYLVKSSGRKI